MSAKTRLSILIFLSLACLAPKKILAHPCHATTVNTNLIHMQIMRDNNRKTRGFAVTVNNDTLRGYFLVGYYKGVVFQKEEKGFGNSMSSILDNSKLRSIFLASNGQNSSSTKDYTEYVYLPEYGRIFRKIYSGKNDYYDENKSLRTPEQVSGDIMIAQKGITKSITHVSARDKCSRKSLIDYLNKTWNTGYSYKDFKTTFEVILEIEKRC